MLEELLKEVLQNIKLGVFQLQEKQAHQKLPGSKDMEINTRLFVDIFHLET